MTRSKYPFEDELSPEKLDKGGGTIVDIMAKK